MAYYFSGPPCICALCCVSAGVWITTGGTVDSNVTRCLGEAVRSCVQDSGKDDRMPTKEPVLIGFANLCSLVNREEITEQARDITTNEDEQVRYVSIIFVPWTIRTLDYSFVPSWGLFVQWTTSLAHPYVRLKNPPLNIIGYHGGTWNIRTFDYSYPGLFVPSWTVRTRGLFVPSLDYSYHGPLAPSLDFSYRRRFVPWTTRIMNGRILDLLLFNTAVTANVWLCSGWFATDMWWRPTSKEQWAHSTWATPHALHPAGQPDTERFPIGV